jgi:protein-histidine pros-kinase
VGLRWKFNLVLLAVFAVGMALAAVVSHRLLDENAKAETLRNAGLMMESAMSVRGYTVNQLTPLLSPQTAPNFPAQSVPAYAATEIFSALRSRYPDFTYKEATLNPTNPRDRAVEWENDVILRFRANPQEAEASGERETPAGRMLWLARPIVIKDGACLACHSVPAAAPASMIRQYGPNNGFGWKLNETVGAQVVSVPMAVPLANAERLFRSFMVALAAIFVATFVVLNVMLSWLVIGPIARMSQSADRVSTGDFEVPEFAARGADEIGVLAASFNRMRRSLEKAMRMIDRA